MKKAMLTLIFGSAIFLAACGGGDDKNKDEESAASTDPGEAVVMKSCISCHGGQELKGQGNTPALNNVGARLSEEEILNVILNGQNGMPAGILKGEDAEAAAKWLATQK